jgi:hypothetical protein
MTTFGETMNTGRGVSGGMLASGLALLLAVGLLLWPADAVEWPSTTVSWTDLGAPDAPSVTQLTLGVDGRYLFAATTQGVYRIALPR